MAGSRARRLGLTLIATLALGGCDTWMGPTSPDANWRIETIGRFTFFVRPGSFAESHTATFAAVLEDQLQTTVRLLGHRYDGRLTLYLYPSGAEAGFAKDLGGGNHSGVAYPETETVKVVIVAPLDGNTLSLLAHEANHVFIRNGLGRPGTTFINEGLASALVSERLGAAGQATYHQWIRNRRGQIPRLADLVDDERWRSYDSSTTYTTSASFLAYVIDRYGAAPLRQTYYAPSAGFAAAFRQAYGRALEDLEAEWLAFVGVPAAR